MSARRGYAMLAALMALVVAVCGTIYVAVEGAGGAGGAGGTRGGSADGVRAGSARLPAATVEAGAAWTGTWSASPAEPGPPARAQGATARSLRNVVHTSIGGTHARITLTNLYGQRPLVVGAASIAVREAGAAAVPGTLRRVTFAGSTRVTVAPGAEKVSDPVQVPVPYDGDLLVTVHTPAAAPVTRHPIARQTSYAAAGDRTLDPGGRAYTARGTAWEHLAAVDVVNPSARGAVVVFGDSITDGVGSTSDTNRRWPDLLADRLRGRGYAVLNQGIGGNCVLRDGKGQSGVGRFQRDALGRSGARTVVISLGINDILRPPHERDARRIGDGLTALTRQAHARGLRVVGSTLMPFGAHRRHSPELEAVRQEVNRAIRAGGVFDEVVDFDVALRDPYAPERLLPAYDSGDGLHPNDAGYRRMAAFLDPADLEGGAPQQL
ncbi:SGNH/GDSL hydrolase family protein [Streptomyces sp. SP18CS02]|uniref:SGNH/GDSL hydrolase family protein n=1 Tax=Streptomyces sp. SP18CS02 TaxID=3002531 RepID=UPI002E7772CA|nr:SGNH/GDSL hydrolase family protein [Streptomyces sp. SP18CS02]MEE1752319.1 SGNH/GDSL hydrolase family protein [Streptomyces sp. SP18CS02]